MLAHENFLQSRAHTHNQNPCQNCQQDVYTAKEKAQAYFCFGKSKCSIFGKAHKAVHQSWKISVRVSKKIIFIYYIPTKREMPGKSRKSISEKKDRYWDGLDIGKEKIDTRMIPSRIR